MKDTFKQFLYAQLITASLFAGRSAATPPGCCVPSPAASAGGFSFALSLCPQTLIGGKESWGNQVVLDRPPSTDPGISLTLTSDHASVAVPAHVNVPGGSRTQIFHIVTTAVTAPTPVHVTLQYAGASTSALLVILPVPSSNLDYNGDGKADILWQHPTNGDVWVWYLNGTSYQGDSILAGPVSYRLVGAADFNHDGKLDLLWQHPTNGDIWIWFMNGTSYQGSQIVAGPLAYKVRGVADLNGDGHPDIVLQHPSNGDVWVWYLVNGIYSGYAQLSGPSSYKVVGAGDFDGDGKSDLLWQHPTNRDVWIWFMNWTSYQRDLIVAGPMHYDLAGVGDYNGDGKLDLLWQHPTNGDVWVWYLNQGVHAGDGQIAGPMTYKAMGWR